MKPTERAVRSFVRGYMTDADCLHYVPVQKFTIAMAMLVTARHCRNCNGFCEKCEISVMAGKLKFSMRLQPMFDGDFNVLPPPKDGAEEGGAE